jgi:outer membrane protein OmpA-like peptidoglycan-associated protein
MPMQKPRRAARLSAAAVAGALAAALALPATGSAVLYKAYDNGVLAYSTSGGSVHTIFQNGTNDATVATAGSPGGVMGVANEWSADGNRLLVTNANTLLDVNPWTQRQVASHTESFAIRGASMSPDGTAYAFGSTANGVTYWNANDSSEHQILGGSSDGTAWSNDDHLSVAFDGNGAYRFYQPLDNPDNNIPGNWSSTDQMYPTHVTISRDGTRVAYTAGTLDGNATDDVYVADANGMTPPTKVEGVTNGSDERYASISPDGRKVAFTSDRAGDGTWSIYIRDLVANTTTKVPNSTLGTGASFTGLSWQPANIPNLAQGTITSAPEVGNTLSLDEMFDEPTAPYTTAWQWQECTNVTNSWTGTCTNIAGATSAGYHLGAGDVGKQYRVVRVVTNGAGSDTDASLITEPVEAPDTTPPGVPTLTTRPGTRSNATSPTFAWTGAEGGGTFQCSVDSAAFTACTSGSAFAVSGEGSHSFRVRQTDASNNVGDPAEYVWTVDTTAPGAPTVSGKPSGTTRATTARFTFTGDEAGGSFECRYGADGASWDACASPTDLTGLSEGAKRFSIRQVDAAGNAGTPDVTTWTVDTTAPGAPTITTKPAARSNVTSPTFAWTGAEAGGTYECSLDGFASVTICTSGWTPALYGEGAQRFSVRQVDAAGNTGAAADYDWTLDTTAPAAPTVTTAPAARSNDAAPAFAWTGAEAGGTYECSLDSAAFAACTSGATVAVSGEGSHTFRVRQVDAAGNRGSAATTTWTFDTTGPAAPSVTSGPDAVSASASATIAFTGAEAGGSYECRVGADGAPWTACTTPVVMSGLSEGAQRFSIRQVDAAGNAGAAKVVTWTVDLTAPVAPVITQDQDAVHTLTTQYAFTGESDATFACQLDNGAWAPCTSPATVSGYSSGAHTFRVRQTDAAGHVSPAAEDAFTAYVDGPARPVLGGGDGVPADRTNKTTASFTFTSGGDVASFECRLDGGAWAACVTPARFASLADGEHTFDVRGIDSYDISGAVTTYRWTVDTAKPAAPTFTGVPAAQTTVRSIDVAVAGIEPGARVECSVDGGAWAACAVPLKLDGFGLGAHTLKLRQTDAAGNVSDEAAFAWTVVAEATAARTQAPAPAPRSDANNNGNTTNNNAARPKLAAVLGDKGTGTSSAATITVRKDGVGVGCSITGTVLTACKVDLYANAGTAANGRASAAAAAPVLVGTGTYRTAGGSKKVQVDVTLNATGRALLRKQPHGLKVSVRITGTPVKGDVLKATGVATLVAQHERATVGGFAINSAKLTAADQRQLRALAARVKGTAVALRAVGHTDASSDDARYLDALGLRRARAVAAFLRAHGVKAKATVVSRGADAPKATNTTAAGRAENRRVELRIDR